MTISGNNAEVKKPNFLFIKWEKLQQLAMRAVDLTSFYRNTCKEMIDHHRQIHLWVHCFQKM